MDRISPLVRVAQLQSISPSILGRSQVLRTQNIISIIIPSSFRGLKRLSHTGSARAGAPLLRRRDLSGNLKSAETCLRSPASQLQLHISSIRLSHKNRIIDLRDSTASKSIEPTKSESTEMATQQPRTDKIEPLATQDAKWIEFKKIHWTDGTGKARVWEAASRTTRGASGIDAVAIAPIIIQPGKPTSTLIILQYRPPVDAICVEFPAGLIDEKETAEEAAVRELREETGFEKVKIVESSVAIANDPGMSMSNMVLTVAEVQMDEGEELPEQQLDEGEEIERVVVPLKDLYTKLEELQKDGKIVDARLWHWAAGVKFGLEHKSWF